MDVTGLERAGYDGRYDRGMLAAGHASGSDREDQISGKTNNHHYHVDQVRPHSKIAGPPPD